MRVPRSHRSGFSLSFAFALGAIALLAGVVVFAVAHELFPYGSVNHDEGVYLQQAAMLVEGRIALTSPVADALQPWFFVRDGARLYPKYAPVPAAVFAPGVAVGAPRGVLGVVAAGNVALIGLLAREAFDDATGVVAAGLALATPFFLLTSATFLPYAPTTLLNLLFAYGYARTCRATALPAALRWAAVAGTAVGLAFFARPYTAVLFAAPFVVHAVWVVGRTVGVRDDSPAERRDPAASGDRASRRLVVARTGVVAFLGSLGVLVALAYNWVQTGDALVFPFAAFAPQDGLGFGYRQIGAYSRVYTPALAVRATAHLLWELATRWTVAAPLGTVAALAGLVPTVRRVREHRSDGRPGGLAAADLPDASLQLLVAGVAVSVVVGNLYFWGTLNTLEALGDPTDGFISLFGPFYHFDLVLPLSVFGAAGTLWFAHTARGALAERGLDRQQRRAVGLAALLVVAPAAGVAQVVALDEPVGDHAAYTAERDRVLEPVASYSFDDAVVFVPTPYGPWLNHPFQSLRNGGSLDAAPVIYAQDRGAASDVAVIDHYPDRTPYRFTYRGDFGTAFRPTFGGPAVGHLERLAVRDGERHVVTTTVGSVGNPSSIRLTADGAAASTRLPPPSPNGSDGAESGASDRLERGAPYTFVWVLNGTHATVRSVGGRPIGLSVPLSGPTDVAVALTFVDGGSSVTYRQEVVVDATGERVRVVWPPEREVCRLATDCGHDGQYVPGGDYVTGVSMNATIETD